MMFCSSTFVIYCSMLKKCASVIVYEQYYDVDKIVYQDNSSSVSDKL